MHRNIFIPNVFIFYLFLFLRKLKKLINIFKDFRPIVIK